MISVKLKPLPMASSMSNSSSCSSSRLQPVAHHVGVIDVRGLVARRLHRDFELRDRTLPRAEHAGIVHVPLLDLLGQLEVAQRVALVGLAQDARPAGAD